MVARARCLTHFIDCCPPACSRGLIGARAQWLVLVVAVCVVQVVGTSAKRAKVSRRVQSSFYQRRILAPFPANNKDAQNYSERKIHVFGRWR